MVERINSGSCIFIVMLTQVSVWMTMGYNLTAINPITPVIRQFVNISHMKRFGIPATNDSIGLIITLSQSMLIVGSALGATTSRFWVQTLSRRGVMTIIHVALFLSTVLMSPVAYLANSYEALIIGRFLNGIARGTSFSVAPLFVAELASRKTFAFYQTPPGWLMQISAGVANGLGLPAVLGGATNWPIFLAIPGLFSLLYLVCLPWIPHTVTWKLKQERSAEIAGVKAAKENPPSLKLLRRMRVGSDEEVLREHEAWKAEMEADEHMERASVRQILTTGKYRRQLIAAILLQFALQATGIQALFQYTNTLFEAAGIEQENSTFYTIGIFVAMSMTTAFSTAVLTRVGSRKMLLAGLSTCSIGLLLLIASTSISDRVPSMKYVAVAAMLLLIVGISLGPILTALLLPTLVTTQVTRPNALWISGILFWFTAAIIAFVIPFTLEAWGGLAYLPFLFLVVAEIFYIMFFVPETRNKSVSEIQKYFETSKKSIRRKSARNGSKMHFSNQHAEEHVE